MAKLRDYCPLDITYAAGVFDVRGGIYLHPNRNSEFRTLRVKLCLIKKKWAVLEYLHSMFGGTITGCSDGRKEWVVCGQKAMRFLELIEPWVVTARRKKQISFLKRRYRSNSPGVPYTKRQKERKRNMEEAWQLL